MVLHEKNLAWQMAINLDTSSLLPVAVQWTVLDQDPVPGFGARVKKMRGYHQERLAQADDDAKELIHLSAMTASWDLGFREVSGDQVYLLTAAPDVCHGFKSDGPGGKKWIVSKSTLVKRKPVCWCIPIEVEAGKELQTTLAEDNMFDLRSAFDEAMREPS